MLPYSLEESMRVIVTGGAGYIGAHICKALCQNGYEPVVVDNLSLGHREAVLWGGLEEGDVSATKNFLTLYSFGINL